MLFRRQYADAMYVRRVSGIGLCYGRLSMTAHLKRVFIYGTLHPTPEHHFMCISWLHGVVWMDGLGRAIMVQTFLVCPANATQPPTDMQPHWY